MIKFGSPKRMKGSRGGESDSVPTPPGSALQDENGIYILDEDGNYILSE